MTHPGRQYPPHAFRFKMGGGSSPGAATNYAPPPPPTAANAAAVQAAADARRRAGEKKGIGSTLLNDPSAGTDALGGGTNPFLAPGQTKKNTLLGGG